VDQGLLEILHRESEQLDADGEHDADEVERLSAALLDPSRDEDEARSVDA
jgi:hypothetical protein